MISVQFSGIEQVVSNLLRYEVEQRTRLRLACEEVSKLLEAHAIMNHPWTVQTQATNVTTRGTWAELASDLYEVVLSAGMEYNKYLELAGPNRGDFAAHEGGLPHTTLTNAGSGKWAWLWPTFISQHEAIMQTFARHLKH